MTIKKVVIIGSGASGIFAAQGLIDAGIRPCVIDVGFTPQDSLSINENFYSISDKNTLESLIIGENLEGLGNFLFEQRYKSPRLRAPKFKFVSEGTNELLKWGGYSQEVIHSLAAGGLANAWGAGAFRYTNEELDQTPLTYKILEPHYDRVSKIVGVCGSNEDDLQSFFLKEKFLQKPVQLSKISTDILKNYNRKKHLINKGGIYVGHPRLAVLTEKLGDRQPLQYNNTEFWDSTNTAIYSPRWTLNELIKKEQIEYAPQMLISEIKLNSKTVILKGIHLNSKQSFTIETEHLILAAGTLQTSSLMLKSFPQYLPENLSLLDNFSFQVPFFMPKFFGSNVDSTAFGSADLSMIFDKSRYGIQMQASVFNMTSIPKSEFYDKIPLDAKMTVHLLKNMVPALGALFVFVDNNGQYKSTISYNKELGHMDLSKPTQAPNIQYGKLCLDLLKLGIWTIPPLIQKVPFGGSIHYTGSLPMMKTTSSNHHVNINGTIGFSSRIRIADGSWMPTVAAKHPTYTFMANAHRIGSLLAKELLE